MENCKECGVKNSDHTQKFCSRKCRIIWKQRHRVKGAKKFNLADAILDNFAKGSGLN